MKQLTQLSQQSPSDSLKYLYKGMSTDGQPPSSAQIFSAEMVPMLEIIEALLAGHLVEVRNIVKSVLSMPFNSANVAGKARDSANSVIESVSKEHELQAKRMMRPLLMPELVGQKSFRWDRWEGTFKIQNIGNSAAIQPVIRVRTNPVTRAKVDRDKIVNEQRLQFIKNNENCPQITVPVAFPVSARSIVTQRPVRLSYTLEIFWRAIYEDGYAKTSMPFYLVLDRSGDARIRMRNIEIDWDVSI